MPRFFDSAPIVSWSTWLRRQVLSTGSEGPRVLEPSSTTPPLSPTGIQYEKCIIENAHEYSLFLEQYYCPPKEQAKLKVPIDYFKVEFETNQLLGIEVRTDTRELVGLVFSRRMGMLSKEEVRLITLFCIAPEWRRKGLADYLLFGIQEASSPCRIFWFRNDGLPRSITPPVWTEQRIVRTIKGTRTVRLKPVSHERMDPLFIDYWKHANPTGILIDPSDTLPILEWYSLQTKLMNHTYTYAVLVANVYEYRGTETTCEILYWMSIGDRASEFAERFILDEIVSMLPYNRIEAPANMPHLEAAWTSSLPTSWYVYGYDVGTPIVRPILSLTVA